MRNTLNRVLKRINRKKSGRIRVFSVLLALSLLVSANVFWMLRKPGVTLAGDAACGLEDHAHTDDCMQTTLVCPLSDEAHEHTEDCYHTEWVEERTLTELICADEEHEHTEDCYSSITVEAHEERTLICTESTEPHVHTEDCYENVPICGKTAHTHTVDCYADENADVETQLDWQEAFSSYNTGDLPADLVSIARAQIGYAESTRNFQLDADGNRSGYTRFGAWYGSPYSDWSALFVSFCLHWAGADEAEMPLNLGADSMARLWESEGLFATPEQVRPSSGDLVFFDDNTVAVIADVREEEMTVVQGDWEDAVAERTVSLSDGSIAGYGLIATQPVATINEEGEFVLADCDCGAGNDAAWSDHIGTCALLTQAYELMQKDVEELAELWPQLPQSTQNYILYGNDTSLFMSAEELAQLKELLNISGDWTERTLAADCGSMRFTVSGLLPEGASFAVTAKTKEEADAAVLTAVNPNNHDLVHDRFVYDLALTVNGEEVQPIQPLKVTVQFTNLTVDEEDFLRVAHLNDAGEALSDEIIDVESGIATFSAEGFSPYLFYTIAKESEGGERILSTEWMKLRDSGWFTYWEQFLTDEDGDAAESGVATTDLTAESTAPASAQQIDEQGGTNESEDGKVKVSKTIAGTELENVFDITLTVETTQEISEVYKEPDMAVVIVLDISNTMKDPFKDENNNTIDTKLRYAAAMEAAEEFLDEFAAQSGTVSKVGFVAFNTDAHKIYDLTACNTAAQATSLKNTMRQKTGEIINATGYNTSHSRFTNMEAGLKMAQDMLSGVSNQNKYVIFLTDGFPTTYIKSGYTGYDPYTSSGTPFTDGVFYDGVKDKYCGSGTSYSDKAAIRAHVQANKMKSDGITIFTAGVNIGGQTITRYDNRTDGLTVIDRTNSTYEIGSASDKTAFKQWLGSSIGSGFKSVGDNTDFYYDVDASGEMKDVFKAVFTKIRELREEASEADWVAQDPMPHQMPEELEFIGFYDRNDALKGKNENLTGSAAENAENTAVMIVKAENNNDQTINWDLKKSGYTVRTEGSETVYSYQLKYRVRLRNEGTGFVENKVYDTNDPTFLTYRLIEKTNGESHLSDSKEVHFPIPAVHGYLVDVSFNKENTAGSALPGAEFTLSHDTKSCSQCHGDGTSTVIPNFVAVSDENGKVTFNNIPSGHIYTLEETKYPAGYAWDGWTYSITVAYDNATITVKNEKGEVVGNQLPLTWKFTIVNVGTSVQLPATGGSGSWPCLIAGTALIVLAVALGIVYRCRTRFGQKGSRAP